jgi:E-phenylitaconyl-CoA hydratase
MENCMTVLFTVESGIATITLNRPDSLNSLTPESMELLEKCWSEVRSNPDIRVAILTGTGSKAFCTGTDMKHSPPATKCMAATYLRDGVPLIPEMKTWKPLIAAINGYAVGGGLEMALACDLRIAASHAKFGLTEVKVASLAGLNGTQMLPRAVPRAVAMKMLLTGEMIDADQALRYGLVSDVAPLDELLPLANRLAAKIASAAPLSVQATKQAATLGSDIPLDHAIAFSHLMWGVLRDTEDRKEGFRAFAEKRDAKYQGF